MSIISDVAVVAPALARILGGPAGAVAATMVTHLLGCKSDLSDLVDKISANPEAMKSLDVELAKIDSSDTSDARSMAEKTMSHMPAFLTVANTIGFFASLFVILYIKLDSSDHDIAYMLLGMLSTIYGSNNQFFFGTNHKAPPQ